MAYGNALVQLEAHLLEKRILLVDDEAELVEMVRAILRAAGFENVSIARSGEEALRAGEAHAFDLFVLARAPARAARDRRRAGAVPDGQRRAVRPR